MTFRNIDPNPNTPYGGMLIASFQVGTGSPSPENPTIYAVAASMK